MSFDAGRCGKSYGAQTQGFGGGIEVGTNADSDEEGTTREFMVAALE